MIWRSVGGLVSARVRGDGFFLGWRMNVGARDGGVHSVQWVSVCVRVVGVCLLLSSLIVGHGAVFALDVFVLGMAVVKGWRGRGCRLRSGGLRRCFLIAGHRLFPCLWCSLCCLLGRCLISCAGS